MSNVLPKKVNIRNHQDDRGNITFIEENGEDINFKIKRVYYIYGVPSKQSRGHHAHKKLEQLMIALNGTIEIVLDDGKNKYKFTLSKPEEGLYVPSGYYRTLKFIDGSSSCLVLASEQYDESDYIRNYNEFLEWKNCQ